MTNAKNVLSIITDQQRADSMGCYGNPSGCTPHLDALAEESTLFERAYCESPICMPSRVSLLTGKHARHHGVILHNNSIRDDERTLAHVYNDAGYYTHCVGKMHCYSQEKYGNPESLPDWRHGLWRDYQGPFCGFQGCDLILGHSNSLYGHYGMWLEEHYPQAIEALWTDNLQPIGDEQVFGLCNAFRCEIPAEAHSSSYVADRCMDVFQRAAEQEQPFFCWASFPDPHWPVCPPAEWLDAFAEAELPPVIPYADECDRIDFPMQYRALKQQRKFYDGGCRFIGHEHEEDMLAIRRAYHAAVAFIDYNVGRIIADLKERGLYDNTIIIFTTDHGDYLGDHGLQAKGGFMYESFIRAPLLIRDPSAPAQRSHALCSFIDIADTLCDLSGIPQSLFSNGISQAPVCLGASDQEREHCTVTHFCNSDEVDAPADQHVLLYEHWKLVYAAGDPNGLLFDLNNDKQELINLWHDPAYQDIKNQLQLRLCEALHASCDRSKLHDKWQIEGGYGYHLMQRNFWSG